MHGSLFFRLFLSGGIFFLSLVAPVSAADITYTDTFDGPAGEINKREISDLNWVATRTFVLDGKGNVVASVDGGVATIKIEGMVEEGDILVTKLVFRAVDAGNGYIRAGFSREALFRDFGPVFLAKAPSSGDADGGLNLISGPVPETGGDIGILAKVKGEADGFKPSEENTVIMTYDTGSGEVSLEVNGVEAFKGPINYNGTGDKADLGTMRYVGFQMQRQAVSDSADPAEVKEFEFTIKRK